MANILDTNANLLVAFDLLASERSVTRAAQRFGITQSAMSSALAQLRELFHDPLLVRVGNRMELTPRGVELAARIRPGIEALASALKQPPAFDPATSRARFVVAMSDFVELVVLPSLLERLSKRAPHVTLQVVGWGRLRPPEALARSEVDLSIGVYEDSRPTPQHHQAALFATRFKCIARDPHPRIGKRLRLSTYVQLGHVLLTEQLGDEGVVDVALRDIGESRRIALRVPHYLMVPHVVARSDLVAAIDERVANHFAHLLPIRLFEPPLDLPEAWVRMIWHERAAHDPALTWLRAQILETVPKS